MASWIVKIGKTTPQHWDFAKEDRLWDIRQFGSFSKIQPGEDIFFWLSGTGLVSWVRASSALYPIDKDSREARWIDVADGGYTHRFNFDLVSEDVVHRASWSELQAAAGRNYAPPAPANPVNEAPAKKFLRSQFDLKSEVVFPRMPITFASDEDLRERAEREITLRRGQAKFRKDLISAYGGACAVTGSEVTAVLEAAHIDRYLGHHTNHVSNGLLLRSDIHTLFDLRLVTIDESMSTLIAPRLRGSEYRLEHGKRLRLPEDDTAHPNTEALARHRKSCDWT